LVWGWRLKEKNLYYIEVPEGENVRPSGSENAPVTTMGGRKEEKDAKTSPVWINCDRGNSFKISRGTK